jgi:hypothetical protein
VPLRRGDLELTVERPLGPEPGAGVVRLSAHFTGTDGSAPDPRELAHELDRLKADLDALVGAPLAAAAARPDRPLDELIETYRPRQRELVDLLFEEGELTPGEHASLVAQTPGGTATASPAPPAPRPSLTEAPLAAVGVVADPPAERGRPVPELLRTYEIETLRQAGAVRARRQISFDEYMALKRHFESNGEAAAADGRRSG